MRKCFLSVLSMILGTGIYGDVFADYHLTIHDKTNNKYGKISIVIRDLAFGDAKIESSGVDEYKLLFSRSYNTYGPDVPEPPLFSTDHNGMVALDIYNADLSHYCRVGILRSMDDMWTWFDYGYEYFSQKNYSATGLNCHFSSQNNNTGDLEITEIT